MSLCGQSIQRFCPSNLFHTSQHGDRTAVPVQEQQRDLLPSLQLWILYYVCMSVYVTPCVPVRVCACIVSESLHYP